MGPIFPAFLYRGLREVTTKPMDYHPLVFRLEIPDLVTLIFLSTGGKRCQPVGFLNHAQRWKIGSSSIAHAHRSFSKRKRRRRPKQKQTLLRRKILPLTLLRERAQPNLPMQILGGPREGPTPPSKVPQGRQSIPLLLIRSGPCNWPPLRLPLQ
ncbi:uncharacterized protein LOC117626438 isoform X2 [Prunus dulcis]|uniref:uncharacterized protein LOC117626438 isoform X2 n=1 Tax=Prunus dulcis TaxID=3755 RepID=UPI0014826911|nr:uncharacterized protein LOC117626438 isoform X2 [Prunus dulcis]